MKNAMIQYTYRAGLGDIITGLYECLDMSLILRKHNYTHLEFKLFFLEKNTYFYPKDFAKIFNVEIFENRFESISIDCEYYPGLVYKNLTYVYTRSQEKPNQHLWDLYLENPDDFKNFDLSCFPYFYNARPIPNWIDIINGEIINRYNSFKKTSPYVTIMFRVIDGEDREDLYGRYENEINNIFKSNNLVFVSSNSYKFKQYIKSKNLMNFFMYDSPLEETFGNHIPSLCHITDEKTKLEKTEHAIFEMLTHSDATEVNLFSCFNGISSFLFFANVKKVKKNLYYLLD